MRSVARWLLCAALALVGGLVAAHEMSMAEMQVREISPGEFIWQWTATNELAPDRKLTPSWPNGCLAQANVLRCGADGLRGTLSMDGIGIGYSAALVKVFWRDGPSRVYTLTSSQPSVRLYGAAEDGRGRGEIAAAYGVLGVEHILGGFDHLLFVVGLLFLVGFKRRLLLTITAFTAAHSITLALGALGWLTLRPPPVEAVIALSIMLVAGEALRQRATLARRWPALVAFLFGLVHGLGFAGALQEIGLPDSHLWVALLTFNIGVEIGQLMTVAAAWAVHRVWRASPLMPTWVRTASIYGIGSMAACWTIGRVAAIVA